MTTRTDFETHFSIAICRGVLNLRLRIRVRWLLAILAAAATLTGSPALVEALARLAG